MTASAAAIWYDAPPLDRDDAGRRLQFGVQLDARPVTVTADRETHRGQLHPETVAAYIAKYATTRVLSTAWLPAPTE